MNVFIGELPPPYGGVTVKDQLLLNEIYKASGIKMLDLVECKRRPYKIPLVGLKLIWRLLVSKNVIVGVGSQPRCKVILKIRKFLRGKKGLSSLRVMVMGGNLHNVTKSDAAYRELLKYCGSVWVETEGMVRSLKEQGIENAKFFPNCRTDQGSIPPREVGNTPRYVFFSKICEEKGVDEVFDAMKYSDGRFTVDFYGEVAADYKERFKEHLENNPTAIYHGVFNSVNGNVYKELNQYDAMLLPTHYGAEGVPGALVEAKMAGIAAIVTDCCFNAEIVKDGVEGIVMNEPLGEILCNMPLEKLMLLKNGAFKSRVRYSIETYRDTLLAEVQ